MSTIDSGPKLWAAGLSNPGRVRESDEDAFVALVREKLFAVADGVGGRRCGALASRLAVESVAKVFQEYPSGATDPEQALKRAFQMIRVSLCDSEIAQSECKGMATTLVALAIRRSEAIVAHIGDSRGYLLRDERLSRLTEDHSFVAKLSGGPGNLDPAALARSPFAHVLTRSLNAESDPNPEIRTLALREGDRILLCCDGVTDMLPDTEVARILHAARSPAAGCQALIDAANDAGGKDNITAVIIDVLPG